MFQRIYLCYEVFCRAQRSFVGEPHFLAFVHSGYFWVVMKLLREEKQQVMNMIVSNMTPTLAAHLTESFLPPKKATAVMSTVMEEMT